MGNKGQTTAQGHRKDPRIPSWRLHLPTPHACPPAVWRVR